MINLKDRAIGATQRDRLSNFLKESIAEGNGCFYYSLLTSWERLNPMKLLPKNTERSLLSLDKDLGVKPSEVVQTIKRLEDKLGLFVSKIVVTNRALESVDDARTKFEFPEAIPITKMEDDNFTPDQGSDGIIYWQRENDDAHYTPLSSNGRFQGEEMEHGNLGGQEGVDILTQHKFLPMLIFQISKK